MLFLAETLASEVSLKKPFFTYLFFCVCAVSAKYYANLILRSGHELFTQEKFKVTKLLWLLLNIKNALLFRLIIYREKYSTYLVVCVSLTEPCEFLSIFMCTLIYFKLFIQDN